MKRPLEQRVDLDGCPPPSAPAPVNPCLETHDAEPVPEVKLELYGVRAPSASAENAARGVETFAYSDYEVWEDGRSRVNPELLLHREVGVRCPRCGAQSKPLDHGQGTICACGLRMQRFGNALECTPE